MNLEQLRRFEKLADNIASTLCFDEEGNEIPEFNWHDQFLVEFAQLVAMYEREKCAVLCERHVCASECSGYGLGSNCEFVIAKEIRARGEVK